MTWDCPLLLTTLILTQTGIATALAASIAPRWRARPALLRWTQGLFAQGLAYMLISQCATLPGGSIIAIGLLTLGLGLAVDAILHLARQSLPRHLIFVLPIAAMLIQALSPPGICAHGHPMSIIGMAQALGLTVLAPRPANGASQRARLILTAGFALGALAFWIWLHDPMAQQSPLPVDRVFLLLQAGTVLSSLALILIHYEREEHACAQLATLDGTTGAYNRGTLIQLGQRELARAMRRERPISLMMVCVDAPPDIRNADNPTENRIRLHLTELMTCTLQRQDLFGYFGGQEFCAVLPDTLLEGARFVAERLCAEARDRSLAECGVSYTVSIGLAESAPSELTFEQIVARASAALAQAQLAGGRRVAVADAAPPARADIREHDSPTAQGA